MGASLETLQQAINYHFEDVNLLHAALTHRSVRGNNNERLEFLGDSVINFIIAAEIYAMFPRAREGDMSRLRASLVKGETLAKVAKEFNLSEYLILGIGEQKSGGAYRASILADAVEAIIGAIYLDSDFETCQQKVLTWFADRLKNSSLKKNLKDPKTLLQEYLQAHKFPLPSYEIVKITGEAHAQTFYISCKVTGIETITEGIGASRRKAEQDAAEQLLVVLNES